VRNGLLEALQTAPKRSCKMIHYISSECSSCRRRTPIRRHHHAGDKNEANNAGKGAWKKTTLLALIVMAVIALMAGCRKSEIVSPVLTMQKMPESVVMTGSTERPSLSQDSKGAGKSFDDIMDAVAAMKSGQIDAIVTAFPAALQVSKKNLELGLLPEPLDYEDTAMRSRSNASCWPH